jgi:aquaporin Z
MKKYLSEIIGTFGLVFCGTGAIIINDISGGTVTHIGIAITFGLIVMTMIYAFGDISGAHFNPAVTVAFWFSGRFPAKELLPYIVSQLIGAFVASGTLKMLFSTHLTLGATLPAGTAAQSFIIEIILAFLLMLVIINVSTGAKEKGITAGIAVGSVVLLGAMFAGPITGASMNPARSIAPAIISGQLQHLWIYITAPFIGTVIGILGCRGVKEKECCPTPFCKPTNNLTR